MSLNTIFISGPMTGIKHFNAPAFYAAEAALQFNFPDAEIINPVKSDIRDFGLDFRELDGTEKDIPGFSLRAATLRDLWDVADADVIFMLSKWENSRGANLEYNLANRLGIETRFENNGYSW